MSAARHFRKAGAKIVSEVIDGEAIIINLDTGCYHSLEGTGAAIWDLIEKQSTSSQMVEALTCRYRCEGVDVQGTVGALLEELRKHDLIEAVDVEEGDGPPDATSGSESESTGELPAFTPTELETHTDMQEFLLVDPIHEVNDTGWPHKKDGSSEKG